MREGDSLKLLIVIAFHFNEKKLKFLKRLVELHPFIADRVECVITTNTVEAAELRQLLDLQPATDNYQLKITSFPELPHPWLLPWTHKQIMLEKFQDPSYTHFLYSEDDIAFGRTNFQYWCWARPLLSPYGVYPSFMRVEFHRQKQIWTMSDQDSPISLVDKKRIELPEEGAEFFCLPNPYQGLFLYDRELMGQHIASPTFDINRYGRIEMIDHNPAWPGGGVAERANFALTFDSVPEGFTSRNVICMRSDLRIFDTRTFVHHLPDNYANEKPELSVGKFPALQILDVHAGSGVSD